MTADAISDLNREAVQKIFDQSRAMSLTFLLGEDIERRPPWSSSASTTRPVGHAARSTSRSA